MPITALSRPMCPIPPQACPRASAMWEPCGLTGSLDPRVQASPAPWQTLSLCAMTAAEGRHRGEV